MGLGYSELMKLIEDAGEIFSKEPQLLRRGDDFLLVGDIHGDFDSVAKAFEIAEKEGLDLIFLGDYVDRGERQIESIAMLLERKLSWRDRLIMLRGNHESMEMNRWYGFYSVVTSQYGRELYLEFAKLFSQLPYAALINDEIFCVHGGLPEGMNRVEEVEEFSKGEIDPVYRKAVELVWNDPCEDIEHFAPSWRGGGAKLFGRRAFENFMETNKLEIMIRAHEPQDIGYGYLFDGRLLSVFSCRYYGIPPAAALIKGSEIKIIYLIDR